MPGESSSPTSMELRKVQLTGGSSLAVTLPKRWAERCKLRPGGMVGFLEQPDGTLSVHAHTSERPSPSEYTVVVDEASQTYLFRKTVAAYLMGYDVIRLTAKRALSATTRKTIRTAVRRMVGLEVVEEHANAIVLQDFLNPGEFPIEKGVRRMGLLTLAMQQEALAALKHPSPDVTASEEDRDAEVDRLYWLTNKQYHALLRNAQFAARMGITAGQALNVFLAARLVERTADHADRIAREAVAMAGLSVPKPMLDRFERHGRRAVELFQNALNAFMARDARRANEIIDEVERFQDGQKRLLREAVDVGGEAVAHLAFILESIGRTAAYASDLGEVAINQKVASA
jgi:phosphate uptake regulator